MGGFGAGGDAVPWGWWLRVNGSTIEDEQGRRWHSVRDAFWTGRIGFPASQLVPEQLELLLRVLSSLDGRTQSLDERRSDLFDGDWLFARFYMGWLESIGMLAPTHGSPALFERLSDEGRSVLLMLQATREPQWITVSFAAVLDAVRNSGRGAADDARDRALRAFEKGVIGVAHLFARETLAGRHVVTLTGLDAASRMPIRKVVWSQVFRDTAVRDDLFAWLAERVDRWEDWGRLAWSNGAPALTSHLLGLFAAGLSPSSAGRS